MSDYDNPRAIAGIPVTLASRVSQEIRDVNTAAEIQAQYDFSGVAASDIVFREATSNGQVITALSVSPLVEDSASVIASKERMIQPCSLDIEASASQRIRHGFSAIDLVDNTTTTALPDDIEIASIYQSNADNGAAYSAVAGTIVTIVLSSPFQGYLSDWIHIYGLVDNRLNYPNLCIKYISYDRKTLTAGFSDEAALPSLAVATITPPAGSAKIRHYHNMGGAIHGASIRFTSSTVTSAALVTQFGGNDVAISGTLVGDHRATIGTTAAVYNAAVRGQYEIKATNRYRLECRPKETAFMDVVIDSNTNFTTRAVRSAVKPGLSAQLAPRIRALNPKSMTRPVAKIVSAVKSGTTTATVTLDRTCASAGIVSNTWMTAKGARDQTNFANFATPVQVTVTGANTLTMVWGGAVTATTYGGSLIMTNGGIDQQGVLAQSIQSATVDATTGVLTLVGSGSWSTGVGVMNPGDIMEIHGCRDAAAGADMGLDGPWRVGYVSTTSLELLPLTDMYGVRRSPAISSLTLTNCGGTVLHRTTLRAHDLVAEQWCEDRKMIDGAGTDRLDKALPVRVVNSVTITGNPAVVGNVAHDSAISGAPVRVAGRARTSDYTAVAADDVADLKTTTVGSLVVEPFNVPELAWQYPAAASGIVNTTTAVTIKAAAGAGLRNYVTGLDIHWDALTNATEVAIRDGAGGSAIWRMKIPSGAAGREVITFPRPIRGTAATLLEVVTITASGAGAVYFNANGYVAP